MSGEGRDPSLSLFACLLSLTPGKNEDGAGLAKLTNGNFLP